MPIPKDEMVLQLDGLVEVNPADSLRGRAEKFIGSRKWSTAEIHYADQEEPAESEEQTKKIWSMTFALGLDHTPAAKSDWFSDVRALVEFIQPIVRETKSEFILEFRLGSKLWYSCTLETLTGEALEEVDFTGMKLILEAEIAAHKKRPWWRKMIGR